MRSVLGHVFSLEAIAVLLVLSLALLVTGFRRQSGAVFLLAVTLATLPTIRSFLLQFFPFWVTIIISVMIVLVVLRFFLGLLLGDAANQTVGQLTADLIKGVFQLPFWLWRKLHLGTLIKRTGFAAGRVGVGAARQSGAYVKNRIAEKRAAVEPQLQVQERCKGTIAAIEGKDYYVDMGDGITGMLRIESCKEQLKVGQGIDCRIVERLDAFMVEVRLDIS